MSADEYFEQLKLSLKRKWCSCGVRHLGAGVSGGPDSMVLLSVLIDVCADLCLQLYVLTVDHNIRTGGESAADADLVLNFCAEKARTMHIALHCEKAVLEKGLVSQTAETRCRGTEDAARFLRYERFEQFIAAHSIDCFCLGHNRNDQLETLIQRFLQGSALPSLSGIQSERGVFSRPLLNVSRSCIIEYAAEKHIPYRIDATNLETTYYRNKIRNKLMPCLDELFPGWDTGVLHGAEKAADFSAALESMSAPYTWNMPVANTLEIAEKVFDSLDIAVRITLLYKALNLLSYPGRVSYRVLKDTAETGRLFLPVPVPLTVRRSNGNILVCAGKAAVLQKTGFYCVLTKSALFELADGLECAVTTEGGNDAFGPFSVPCVLRNCQCADKVICADGSFKSLSKVFSDWKVPEPVRSSIPIVETRGTISAVFGSCYGYKNWIVKNTKPEDALSASVSLYITFRNEK